MTNGTDAIERLVADLKALSAETRDPRAILALVSPLVRDLALSKTWLEAKHYVCDPAQGFGAHLLHEEQDHTLAIFAGAWLPGRGAPPHNHGTWAVLAGVIGTERNTLWTRVDDRSRPGYAEVRKHEERVLGPGDVLTLLPDAIHSVLNETDSVTVSLHVYGKHVNHTDRAQFDPEGHTARDFIVEVS